MSTNPTDEIAWKEHMKDMAEFEPYMEFLEDQTEMETAVKWLMECPHPDYLSEEFQQALFREVRAQVEWFKENTEIKETEEKVVTKMKKQRYLSYDNE